MKRVLRQLLFSLLWPVALAVLIVLAINTDPGRRLVVWAVIESSGGRVVPSGLAGELPFAPLVSRLEIHDRKGPWLRLEQVTVSLKGRRLLHGELAISAATARSVRLLRLPEPGKGGGGVIGLPFRVVLHRLAIDALELQPWPDAPVLAIEGGGRLAGDAHARVSLAARVPGRVDLYLLDGAVDGDDARFGLWMHETAGGIGSVWADATGVTLPTELGTWSLEAVGEGPFHAMTIGARLDAGSIQARIDGSLDLVGRASGGLRLAAELPEMGLASDTVAWRAIRMSADLSGDLDAPRGSLHADAEGLVVGGFGFERLSASAVGDGARVRLLGELQGLIPPRALPESATQAPLQLWVEIEPLGPGRPFRLAVAHPLVEVTAAGTLGDRRARASLGLPDLGVIADPAGVPVSGSARIDLRVTAADSPRIDALGELRLTRAPEPILGLLGPVVGVGFSVLREAGGWQIDGARLDGRHLSAAMEGRVSVKRLDLGWSLNLGDLAAIDRRLSGKVWAIGGVSGSPADLRVVADLGAETRLATPAGAVELSADGDLDVPARRLGLRRLQGEVAGVPIRLSAPAKIDLADGVVVDRLRLGLGGGAIEIAGRLSPRLDLDASIAGLAVDLVRLATPDLPLDGTLDAALRLRGPLNAPEGSIRAEASGLRLTEGQGRGLPPARVELDATLDEAGARLDARAEIPSRADLRLRGRVGGSPHAPKAIDLTTHGRIDLSLLDPLLTAGGRQLLGQARLDADIAGRSTAPRIDGDLHLSDASFWDRRLGLALTNGEGHLRLAGDTLRVERLSARAGNGDLMLDGTLGLLSPGIPVDLRLIARDASPIQLDLLNARGDADLRLRGLAREALGLSGQVRLRRVEIRPPERLPPTIAVLKVRERGRATHRRARARGGARLAVTQALGLDLAIEAPRAIQVRGRGIDAHLGGAIRLTGTAARPEATGGFDLLEGRYELAGQTLRFSRGRLGFDGATGLDPTLDLEARATAAGSTGILQVLGTASAPRIELRGEPEMPEDEVLSRLLFGVAGGRLSRIQAARLGVAAATLAGLEALGGPGFLDQARAGLGLDRLFLGRDDGGNTTLEAGRYLSERVYLGARQGTRAGDTQGVVRFELTPRIRLETDVGSGGGTRAGGAFELEY